MSIKTLQAKVVRAKKAIQSVNEAAAAATAELTSQNKEGPTPEETTFTIPADGINLGQLEKERKQNVGQDVDISMSSSTVTIKSSNAIAVTRVLKKLGIVVDVAGVVVANRHTDDGVAA